MNNISRDRGLDEALLLEENAQSEVKERGPSFGGVDSLAYFEPSLRSSSPQSNNFHIVKYTFLFNYKPSELVM